VEEVKKVEEEKKDEFIEERKLLKDMGFENDTMNLYLLKKFNGNIQKIVKELISQ